VAAFYADECFPLPVVDTLRRGGHDVLTALDAGHANQGIPDEAVLAFATEFGRAVLTMNRRQFIGLHARHPEHAGIVVCTQDPDVDRQAAAIDVVVSCTASLQGTLVRINRPG
jgi:hypothetical protein